MRSSVCCSRVKRLRVGRVYRKIWCFSIWGFWAALCIFLCWEKSTIGAGKSFVFEWVFRIQEIHVAEIRVTRINAHFLPQTITTSILLLFFKMETGFLVPRDKARVAWLSAPKLSPSSNLTNFPLLLNWSKSETWDEMKLLFIVLSWNWLAKIMFSLRIGDYVARMWALLLTILPRFTWLLRDYLSGFGF